MNNSRQSEGSFFPKTYNNGAEVHALIKFFVLKCIKHIKSTDPEKHQEGVEYWQ